MYSEASLLIAISFMFCTGGCGAQDARPVPIAAVPKMSSAQLARDLTAATHGSVSDRCAALRQLGNDWSRKRKIPGGFSDVPIEKPEPEAPAIQAGDIEAIAIVLQTALADSHHEIREAASICLARAPHPSPAIGAAIAVALSSEDGTVLWYLSQLDFEKFPLPDPGPFAANLIKHLKSDKFSSRHAASDLIQGFGKRFVPYTATMVGALTEISEDDKWIALLCMARAGISEDAANQLAIQVKDGTPETKALAFVALCSVPDKAASFLRDHPGLGANLSEYDRDWYEILFSTAPEQQNLRAALSAVPDLGPLNLAFIGSADSIPMLTRQLETATNHEKPLFRACMRACGGKIDEVVHLSQNTPVVFKPKSAWPETDPRRKSDAAGHGDGFTAILVTGELKFADGGHPSNIQILRTNDGMLLGESHSQPMPVKYDPATGRFVIRTDVFAAYATGSPPEPGPYQTGSAQVRIESTDAEPF
ncbi:MAG: Secreted protein, partial [Planctomycetaceae bacterium]|nr:Secreted protein [Planctomycetaceae bacterium]